LGLRRAHRDVRPVRGPSHCRTPLAARGRRSQPVQSQSAVRLDPRRSIQGRSSRSAASPARAPSLPATRNAQAAGGGSRTTRRSAGCTTDRARPSARSSPQAVAAHRLRQAARKSKRNHRDLGDLSITRQAPGSQPRYGRRETASGALI